MNQPWQEFLPEDTEGQRAFGRRPVVYAMFDEGGDLLYVGATNTPAYRWTQHRRTQPWWPTVHRIAVAAMSDRHEAHVWEGRIIGRLQPRYNRRGNPRAGGWY